MSNASTFRRLTFVGLVAALTGGVAGSALAQAPAPGQPHWRIPEENKGKVIPIPIDKVNEMSKLQADATQKATQPGQALPDGLEVSEKSFDWGDISDIEPVEHPIKFKNITGKTIKVTAQASCGCTVAAMTKTEYAPGEEGEVRARFDPHGRTGPQAKTITITVTDPPNSYMPQMVNLTSNVKALVTIEPPKLFMSEVDHREGKVEKLVVIGRKSDFQVLKAESNSEFIKVKVLEAKTIEANNDKVVHVPIEVTVGKGAPIGNLTASLTFTTNDEKAKVQPYFMGADIVGDVRCSPPQAIIRTNLPATAFSNEMRIDSRSATPFKIASIDVEARKDMQAVADVRPSEGGKYYVLTLSGTTPADQGMYNGTVIVTTDANEIIRVPFTAAIAKPGSANPALR